VEWTIEKGDEWDVTIYQIPPEGQRQPLLTHGLIAGFGMILLLVTSVSYGIRLGKEDETAKRPDWREEEELEEELGVRFYD
jgi:hypothetical protein